MTSSKQRAANQRNAQRSTGPRSAAGKSVSRLNALRHGLSARFVKDSSHDLRVEALAKIIAGSAASASEFHHARNAAEATVQIARIRAARTAMLDPSARNREIFSWSFPARVQWRRGVQQTDFDLEAAAVQAGRDPGDGSTFEQRHFWLMFPLERFPPIPSGPEASVDILQQFIGQVAKLDRYEARQLSLLMAAIRGLDALRAMKAETAA